MSNVNITKDDRLHWKVKNQRNFDDEFDFLETLLITDGVKKENIPKFLNPTKELKNDPFLLINMKKAIKMVHDVIKKDGSIFVKIDCD